MEKATENEKKVLTVIYDIMRAYDKQGQPGFSDVTFEDIEGETGFDSKTVKGLLESVIKKDFVFFAEDVNGEYKVYYLTQKGEQSL